MQKLIHLLMLTLAIISCSNDDDHTNEYKFIAAYSTTVTVGGFVGVAERTFEIGERYTGTDQSADVITIRIAEHTELNDDCPNSWCYQELVDVPREFLQVVE